jgi:hypothetical protein
MKLLFLYTDSLYTCFNPMATDCFVVPTPTVSSEIEHIYNNFLFYKGTAKLLYLSQH